MNMRITLSFFFFGILFCTAIAFANETRVIAKAGDLVESENGPVAITQLQSASGGLTSASVSGLGHIGFNAQIGSTTSVIQREPDGRMRIIASTGDDIGGGLRITSVGAPILNNYGRSVFFTTLTGAGVSSVNNNAFMATLPVFPGGPSGTPRILLREGMPFPDGAQVATFPEVLITEDSDDRWFSVRSQLSGSGVTSSNNRAIIGVINSTEGGIWLRSGATAPGTGSVFNELRHIISPLGDTLFYSTLSGSGLGPSNSHGIWVNDPLNNNLPLLIARSGVAAPGTTTGANFSALWAGTSTPLINSVRTVALSATTTTPTGVIGGGIFLSREGDRTLQPLFVTGSSIAGLTVAGPYSPYNQRSFYLGDDDRVLSWILLSGAGVNSGNNIALAVNNHLGTRILLRAGDLIEQVGPGMRLSGADLGAHTVVNRRGDFATWVKLQGPGIDVTNNYAMVAYIDDQLRIVARTGQAIPNAGSAVISELAVPRQMFMNNRGDLVFMARAAGGGLPVGGEFALVSVNREGRLDLVVIANRPFELADGVTTRVQSFGYESSPLTDDGRFVFSGTVTLPGIGSEAIFETTISQSNTPACPADFNSDGTATVQDIFDFLSLWFAQDTGADFNRDSAVTVQDLFDFLEAWFGGC